MFYCIINTGIDIFIQQNARTDCSLQGNCRGRFRVAVSSSGLLSKGAIAKSCGGQEGLDIWNEDIVILSRKPDEQNAIVKLQNEKIKTTEG